MLLLVWYGVVSLRRLYSLQAELEELDKWDFCLTLITTIFKTQTSDAWWDLVTQKVSWFMYLFILKPRPWCSQFVFIMLHIVPYRQTAHWKGKNWWFLLRCGKNGVEAYWSSSGGQISYTHTHSHLVVCWLFLHRKCWRRVQDRADTAAILKKSNVFCLDRRCLNIKVFCATRVNNFQLFCLSHQVYLKNEWLYVCRVYMEWSFLTSRKTD